MTSSGETKTLGQAIDEIIKALQSLDVESKITAIKATCDHLKIELPGTKLISAAPPSKQSDQSSGESGRVIDIRTLKLEKSPSTANEMAALVAYYLGELIPENERKAEVEVSDMEKYFKQAPYPLPKNPQMLLHNAKKAGYFEPLGNGKFKLNPVGYNLVVHSLPKDQVIKVSKRKVSSRVKKNKKSKRK